MEELKTTITPNTEIITNETKNMPLSLINIDRFMISIIAPTNKYVLEAPSKIASNGINV